MLISKNTLLKREKIQEGKKKKKERAKVYKTGYTQQELDENVQKYLQGNISAKDVQDLFGIPKSTLRRHAGANKIKR